MHHLAITLSMYFKIVQGSQGHQNIMRLGGAEGVQACSLKYEDLCLNLQVHTESRSGGVRE